MTLEITQEDIDISVKKFKDDYIGFDVICDCVISQCFRRTFKTKVRTGVNTVRASTYLGAPFMANLPYHVVDQIRLFDTKKFDQLTPMTFEMDDNALKLAGFIVLTQQQ